MSRARLVVHAASGGSRVSHASSTMPQRWAFGSPATNGWVDVYHQLVGDGVFSGESWRTAIAIGPGARATVRSIAATPLRGPGTSAAVTRINVAPGATLIHVPGALIPQRGADHTMSLSIRVAEGACAFAANTLVLGRTGMRERGAFKRLRIRTGVWCGGALAYAEDSVLDPGAWLLDGPAGFAGAEAALSIFAVGQWGPAEAGWWNNVAMPAGARGRASRLRAGGVAFRALCRTLGDAQELLADAERRLRPGVDAGDDGPGLEQGRTAPFLVGFSGDR